MKTTIRKLKMLVLLYYTEKLLIPSERENKYIVAVVNVIFIIFCFTTFSPMCINNFTLLRTNTF